MSGFVTSIFSLFLIFTIACALVSDRRFHRVERYLFSLIFASVLFTSLVGWLGGNPCPELVLPEGVEDGEHTFDEVMTEAMKTGVTQALCSEFSLSPEDFVLTLSDVDKSTHLPNLVTVVLQGKGIFQDTRRIEDYLKQKGGFRDVRVSIRLDT